MTSAPTDFSGCFALKARGAGLVGMGRRFSLGVWAFSLAILPVYLMDDGRPQVFHVVSLVLMVVVFSYALGSLRIERDLLLVAFVFCTYVIYVNVVWFAQTYDYSFVWSSSYYCYNFVLFFLVVAMAKALGSDFASASRIGIGCGVFVQILAVTVGFRAEFAGGAVGTFFNPNQLGYWAVVSVAAYLVLQRRARLRIVDSVILGGALWLTAISLSRAAICSIVILLFTGVSFQKLHKMTGRIVAAGAGAVLSVVLIVEKSISQTPLLQDLAEELERRTPYDSLHGRGFDRIWEFDEYLLFGAGEGAYERFATSPYYFVNELHSSFANILFSYGVVGFGIFSVFLGALLKRLSWRAATYVIPVLLYGVAHNSFRFSVFWIFLGVVYAVAGTMRRRPVEEDLAMVQNSKIGRAHFLKKAAERLKTMMVRRRNGEGLVINPAEEREVSTVLEVGSTGGDVWVVDRGGVVLLPPQQPVSLGSAARVEAASLGSSGRIKYSASMARRDCHE